MMTVAEGEHVGSDHPEFIGKERQAFKFWLHFVEKFVTWAIHPSAFNCGRFIRRNLPKLRETAKVIEAYEVAGLRSPTQALNPPAISVRANRVPLVERISPPLAGRAEVVRRHAGNDFGLKIGFFKAK